MPIPYEIPAHLVGAVNSGQAGLFGAIIKDSVTGQILGHVQQTSMLSNLSGLGVQLATSGFSPLSPVLDGVSVYQNSKILSTLKDLNALAQLNNYLHFGTIALSGLGIGVSVVGFFIINRKLDKIQKRLSEKIEQVTYERRNDELTNLMGRVRANLRLIEELRESRNPIRVTTELRRPLLEHTEHLKDLLSRGTASQLGLPPSQSIQLSWHVFDVIRVCQDASMQVRIVEDELETAQLYARNELEYLLDLRQNWIPGELASASMHSQDPLMLQSSNNVVLNQAQAFATGIDDGVRQLASQASIVQNLKKLDTTGPEFLKAAECATDVPFIYVGTADQRNDIRRLALKGQSSERGTNSHLSAA